MNKVLQCIASDASANAVQSCKDKGIPYTILKDTKLVKIFPNGDEEILKEYTFDEIYFVVDKSKIYRVDKNATH